MDEFNREALAIEIDPNLPAPRVIRVLERIVAWRAHHLLLFFMALWHWDQGIALCP